MFAFIVRRLRWTFFDYLVIIAFKMHILTIEIIPQYIAPLI